MLKALDFITNTALVMVQARSRNTWEAEVGRSKMQRPGWITGTLSQRQKEEPHMDNIKCSTCTILKLYNNGPFYSSLLVYTVHILQETGL